MAWLKIFPYFPQQVEGFNARTGWEKATTVNYLPLSKAPNTHLYTGITCLKSVMVPTNVNPCTQAKLLGEH